MLEDFQITIIIQQLSSIRDISQQLLNRFKDMNYERRYKHKKR